MIPSPDQDKVKELLRESITLLCRNGLHYKSEFSVEALIGITLDNDEVFLVNIKEKVQGFGEGFKKGAVPRKSAAAVVVRNNYDDQYEEEEVEAECEGGIDPGDEDDSMEQTNDLLDSQINREKAEIQPPAKIDFSKASPPIGPPSAFPLLPWDKQEETDRICDICSKKFSSAKNMQLHRNLHLGIYKFRCPVCNKGFSGATNLKGHMPTHTHEFNYKCTECRPIKRYRYLKNFRIHREKIHNDLSLRKRHKPGVRLEREFQKEQETVVEYREEKDQGTVIEQEYREDKVHGTVIEHEYRLEKGHGTIIEHEYHQAEDMSIEHEYQHEQVQVAKIEPGLEGPYDDQTEHMVAVESLEHQYHTVSTPKSVELGKEVWRTTTTTTTPGLVEGATSGVRYITTSDGSRVIQGRLSQITEHLAVTGAEGGAQAGEELILFIEEGHPDEQTDHATSSIVTDGVYDHTNVCT